MGCCGSKKQKQPNEPLNVVQPPPEPISQVSMEYFLPTTNNLFEFLKNIYRIMTAKAIVDQLIQGKKIEQILESHFSSLDNFSDLAALAKEYYLLLFFTDSSKIRKLTQIESFLKKLTNSGYNQSHEKFIQFVGDNISTPTAYAKACEIEKMNLYILSEIFAAFQVLRNDQYFEEKKHWWYHGYLDLTETNPPQQTQTNQHYKPLPAHILNLPDTYLNYYLEKIENLQNQFNNYISQEEKAKKALQQESNEIEEIAPCDPVGDIKNMQFNAKKEFLL